MPELPPQRKRWRWFRREAIDLGDVVVQIFSVVIGILLALAINDWVQQRQQRANVDEAMRAIRLELSTNRVALRAHAKQMFAMAEAIRASPANRNQPPRLCFTWDKWTGVGGLNLTDAAYRTAIATRALANMPFKQAQAIAQVYGWQNYFQEGIDIDVRVMSARPQDLDTCVDFVANLGRENLQLDARYAPLIGPDTAKLPKPPILPPATAAPRPSQPSPSRSPA